MEPNTAKPVSNEPENNTNVQDQDNSAHSSADEGDGHTEQQGQAHSPESMETEEETPKEVDDGVVDVSGILKDIDDFNRSSEALGDNKDAEAQEETKEASATGGEDVEKSGEEPMETDESPPETTKAATHTGDDEGPDTSQAIAALKSLESYDDVDSRESNEPVHFSEDIVDEEKAPEGDDTNKEKEQTESSLKEKHEEEIKEDNESKVNVFHLKNRKWKRNSASCVRILWWKYILQI